MNPITYPEALSAPVHDELEDGAAVPHFTAGATFAGYRIESVAGIGGMGIVYRATHLALGTTVALKIVMPELADDPSFRERFKRECRMAASIRHPNVVRIHHAGEEQGRLFQAMELIDGGDLRELVMRNGLLPLDRAVCILGQVASALDAAHAVGLVHRDVKPANVLIEDATGDAFLTDFGLSKSTTQGGGVTHTGQWLGTPDYIAPEQIRGDGTDARTDVYALGAVLFQMVTGEVPFAKENDAAKLFAHMTDMPPAPSTLRPDAPPALDAVVARAMAKDPAERYGSAGELAAAAAQAVRVDALNATQVVAKQPRPTQPPPPVPPTAPVSRAPVWTPPPVPPVPPLAPPPGFPPVNGTSPVSQGGAGPRRWLLGLIPVGGLALVGLVGGAIAIGAAGGMPDDQLVRDRVAAFAAADTGEEACDQYSEAYVRQTYQSADQCVADEKDAKPFTLNVGAVTVTGDSAVVQAQDSPAGDPWQLRLVRDGDEWLIAGIKADEAQVRGTVRDYAATSSGEEHCALLSKGWRTRVEEDGETCEQVFSDVEPTQYPVEGIDVTGSRAEVRTRETNGQLVILGLVKEGAVWKIDEHQNLEDNAREIVTTYLTTRDGEEFCNTLTDQIIGSDPGDFRACVKANNGNAPATGFEITDVRISKHSTGYVTVTYSDGERVGFRLKRVENDGVSFWLIDNVRQ